MNYFELLKIHKQYSAEELLKMLNEEEKSGLINVVEIKFDFFEQIPETIYKLYELILKERY